MKYCILGFLFIIGIFSLVILPQAFGYYEDRYYCTIDNGRITISTSRDSAQYVLCLSMIQILHTNVAQYVHQLADARTSLAQIQGQNTEIEQYWTGYISSLQKKVVQSRVLHTQIINAMNRFESDLYKSTMKYIMATYAPVGEDLVDSIVKLEANLSNAIVIGDFDAVARLHEMLFADRRKQAMIVSMLQSTNFGELMPFYTAYQQGGFEF